MQRLQTRQGLTMLSEVSSTARARVVRPTVLRQQRKQPRARYTERCMWRPSCTLHGDAAEPCAPQPLLAPLNTEQLPLVTSGEVVAETVRYQDLSLYAAEGAASYLTLMRHRQTEMPRRLPGLNLRVLNVLPADRTLVVRWRAEWPAPKFLKTLRDVHGAWHTLLYGREDTTREGDEEAMYLVWGSTQLVRDSDGLVCEHLDTIDFDPEGPTNDRAWALFDFCLARRSPDASPLGWSWMVLKLFLYQSLREGEVGEELAVLNDDEREEALTWMYGQQAILAFVAAATTAALLIQLDRSIKALVDFGAF